MVSLIQEKLRNNNHMFFKQFTASRKTVEQFLIDNKSVIGLMVQNLNKGQRAPKVREMFDFLVSTSQSGQAPTIEDTIAHLGIRGRILDANFIQTTPHISDDTKSMVYVREAITKALTCPICHGLLDSNKSVSYDHIDPRRAGGSGDYRNVQLVHPYCNSGSKEAQAAAGKAQKQAAQG